MPLPNFCPHCGKPLQADLVWPFTVGPHDYASGGYEVICRSEEYCWQGEIYPTDEARGRVVLTVEREAGRIEKLLNVFAEHWLEYTYRVEAQLRTLTEDEIRALIAKLDAAASSNTPTDHDIRTKNSAEAELARRWHVSLWIAQLFGSMICLYHACDAKDCVTAPEHRDEGSR
jgi:hypothetical protein